MTKLHFIIEDARPTRMKPCEEYHKTPKTTTLKVDEECMETARHFTPAVVPPPQVKLSSGLFGRTEEATGRTQYRPLTSTHISDSEVRYSPCVRSKRASAPMSIATPRVWLKEETYTVLYAGKCSVSAERECCNLLLQASKKLWYLLHRVRPALKSTSVTPRTSLDRSSTASSGDSAMRTTTRGTDAAVGARDTACRRVARLRVISKAPEPRQTIPARLISPEPMHPSMSSQARPIPLFRR